LNSLITVNYRSLRGRPIAIPIDNVYGSSPALKMVEQGKEVKCVKTIRLKIPSRVARYFDKEHGGVTKLSQGLLNDALRSILEGEEAEDPDKIAPLVEMLKPY